MAPKTPPRGATVTRACDGCGKPYQAREADLARGWGRNCSKACAKRARVDQAADAIAQGKVFLPPTSEPDDLTRRIHNSMQPLANMLEATLSLASPTKPLGFCLVVFHGTEPQFVTNADPAQVMDALRTMADAHRDGSMTMTEAWQSSEKPN